MPAAPKSIASGLPVSRPTSWQALIYEHDVRGHVRHIWSGPRSMEPAQAPLPSSAPEPAPDSASARHSGAHPMHIEDLRLFENGVRITGCIRPGVAPTPATSALLRRFVQYVFAAESLATFLNDLLPVAEQARALAVLDKAQAVDHLEAYLNSLGPESLLARVRDDDEPDEPDFWVFGESLHALVISALGQVHLQRVGRFETQAGHAVGMRRVFIANALDTIMGGTDRI